MVRRHHRFSHTVLLLMVRVASIAPNIVSMLLVVAVAFVSHSPLLGKTFTNFFEACGTVIFALLFTVARRVVCTVPRKRYLVLSIFNCIAMVAFSISLGMRSLDMRDLGMRDLSMRNLGMKILLFMLLQIKPHVHAAHAEQLGQAIV